MRIAFCFLYILLQIVYLLPWLPATPIVHAFGLTTHIAMAGLLFYWLSVIEGFTGDEKLFFEYCTALSVANCVYIIACALKGTSFAIYNTPLFAFILAVACLVFVFHCGIKRI